MEFDKYKDGPEAYLHALSKLIESSLQGTGRVVAVGECGLGALHILSASIPLRLADYDRTHIASKDVQCRYFRTYVQLPFARPHRSTGMQLGLAKKYRLPLFLHSRAAHADFVNILREEGFDGKDAGAKGGVVHSFTGTVEELHELVSHRHLSLDLPNISIHRWKWVSTSGLLRSSGSEPSLISF
jgi:TatD DNase family protein